MSDDKTIPALPSGPELNLGEEPSGLGDRYSLVRRLGEGTSGAVFEAIDHLRQERVALKMLKSLDARSLYRFKREFRALVDVRHRNLVELYELASFNDQWFFTMELIEGSDFISRVNQATTLEGKRELFAQLARGLNALHQRGLLHRDVKPSNVLVHPSGRVAIVDFGIIAELGMRESARLDGEGISGTPAYMAPEQCLGEPLTGAADWYAVGIMLFEAFAGHRPFAAGMAGVRDRIVSPAPRLREYMPDAPADLDALCADLMETDPTARASGDAIVRRLGGGSYSSSPPSVAIANGHGLVGRVSEMATLDGALCEVRAGRPTTVFVHGTSGMGKTSLVEQFMTKAAAEGALVLPGRCYEREAVPFKAFDGFMDVLVRHLADRPESELKELLPPSTSLLQFLFPVIGSLPISPQSGFGGDVQRRRWLAFEALRLLLTRLASKEPVIVFLDDVQWADSDSAQLLGALLVPPDEPRVLTVLGYRSEHGESNPLLTRARALAKNAHTIAVGPLSDADARKLLSERLDSEPPPAMADRVVAEAGGNPFFVEEYARFFRDAGTAATELSLEEVLTARFQTLDESARHMLQAITLAGIPLTVALAGSVAGLAPERHASVERTLRRAQFIRTAATGSATVEPFHDRIREAATLTLSAPDKRRLHGQFVTVLIAAEEDDPDALYTHCHGAGLMEQAVSYASKAATRAFEALAFERAASRCEDALGLVPDDDPRAQGWRVLRADALAAAGRFNDAGAAYERAAERASPEDVIRFEARASEQYLCGGYVERGTVTARRVLERVNIKLPASPVRTLLSVITRTLWRRVRGIGFEVRSGDEIPSGVLTRVDVCYAIGAGFARAEPLVGADLALRGLSWSLASGQADRVARAIAFVGLIGGLEGGASQRWGVRLHETAVRLAPQGSELEAIVRGARSGTSAMHGEWGMAVEHGRRTVEVLRDHPTCGWERRFAAINLCAGLTYLGHLNEAREHGASLLREARDSSDLYTVAIATSCWAYLFDLADDDLPAMRAAMAAASSAIPDKPVQLFHGYAVMAEVQGDLYEGQIQRAEERLAEGLRILKPALLLRVRFLRVGFDSLGAQVALAKLSLGQDVKANRRIADKHVRELRRDGAPWPVGLAELVRGGLAAIDKGPEAAIEPWQRAITAFEEAGMMLHTAATRYRLGQVIGGDRGEELVRQAGTWMAEQRVKNPERMIAMLVQDVT